ncbi:MAG: Nif3-like dinuclear metal center hexameric protein, partial [Bacteroidales bacterium]|nr:Nif3-like dinuclear metal center hexameric protein [Bacteroidales bacterium]
NIDTMTTINDVVSHLDLVFRPELQEDYDNSGFLLGDGGKPYSGALVALDLTDAVADEALELGLNMIVTHHPFIFGGVKRITDHTATGRLIQKLVLGGMAVYAAHTNLDNLAWGVNGELCGRLGLHGCRIMRPQKPGGDTGAGMVGELESDTPCDEFLGRVKSILGLAALRCTPHDARQPVRRVAVCGGAGSFLIEDALAAGADIYLTADLKYHDFQRTERGMVLADVGHYESEQFAKDIIFRTLSEKFCNFACRISGRQGSLIRCM